MVWISSNDEETTVIWELSKVDDRTAAITAGSLLEQRLESALKNVLHDNPEITTEMFRETGPLGPFGTKIRLGFMLGLYSLDAYNDLKRISKIRNMFAHKLWAKSFSINEIANDCNQLKLVERHIFEATKHDAFVDVKTWQKFFIADKDTELRDAKKRYLFSVMIISTMLVTLPKVGGQRMTLLEPRF